MEPQRVPKFFGFLSHRNLKLSFNGSKSKSSSTLGSPRTLGSSMITKGDSSREDELREVFRHFDSDDDGKISALELRAYFGSIGEYMSHEEAEGVINVLDTDGDNSIDFRDFLRLMRKESDDNNDDDIKKAFEMFELQKGSGRITPKSLQRMLRRLGDSKSYDECVAMIQVFDVDGNGELDFHEFHQMMG